MKKLLVMQRIWFVKIVSWIIQIIFMITIYLKLCSPHILNLMVEGFQNWFCFCSTLTTELGMHFWNCCPLILPNLENHGFDSTVPRTSVSGLALRNTLSVFRTLKKELWCLKRIQKTHFAINALKLINGWHFILFQYFQAVFKNLMVAMCHSLCHKLWQVKSQPRQMLQVSYFNSKKSEL